MTLAIIIIVIAQFLNAIVSLIDKYIISARKVPNAAYYAFFVSILSTFSIFVFLFGFIDISIAGISIPSILNIEAPSLIVSLVSLAAGAFFFFALWSLFTAFRSADASDVIPVVGSVSAIVAFPLGYFVLGSRLHTDFLIGLLFLIIGALILSHYRFKRRIFYISVLSGLFFSLHFISLKYLFGVTSFDNAFFWSRIGIVLVATLVFIPRWKTCTDCYFQSSKGSTILILGNKVLSGVSGFLLLKAIDISDVALVQALGSIQFVFLFIISLTIGGLLPSEIGENLVGRNKTQKAVAISVIVIGFLLLFLV